MRAMEAQRLHLCRRARSVRVFTALGPQDSNRVPLLQGHGG